MAAIVQALIGSSVASGGGGIALVQSASGTTADGSAGLTVSFGVPVTAGNSVITLISFDTSTGAEIVDDEVKFAGGAGIDFVIASSVTDVLDAQQWKKTNASGGQTGCLYTLTEAVRASMTILEFSGLANAAAEDTSTNSGSSAVLSFGEISPTSANNLIVGIGAYSNATQEYFVGPDAPFTRVGTGVGGASVWQEVEYAIQAAATPQESLMLIYLSDGGDPRDFATAATAFGGA